MFDPDAHLPRMNEVWCTWCLSYRWYPLAREKQVNIRVVSTRTAVEEPVNLAHEIFNRVFRRVPEQLNEQRGH
jgi:hypothetical protein